MVFPNKVFLLFVIVFLHLVHSGALPHRDNISKTVGQFVFEINLDGLVAKTRERSAGYFVIVLLIFRRIAALCSDIITLWCAGSNCAPPIPVLPAFNFKKAYHKHNLTIILKTFVYNTMSHWIITTRGT